VEIFRGLQDVPESDAPTFLALGMFDGVHLGHRAVLAATVAAARTGAGRSLALTFDPHPQRIIAPPPEPILLTTVEERVEFFAGLDLDAAVIVRFDETLRRTPAGHWMEMLAAVVRQGSVLVSSTYTFGQDRGGTVEVLRAGGARLGFGVTVVPPVHVEGALVSSTLIRRLLRSGAVEEAGRFLGRLYTVRGRVVEGERRGRVLGFPTANLAVHPDKVLPGRGIYAAWGRLEGGIHAAAVSVGTRPTFGPGALLVEAHLLDFDADLYGQDIELVFVSRVRDEVAFRTVPELVAQMESDVSAIRRFLAPRGGLGPDS